MENVLSVSQLCQHTHSTSSSLTGAGLIGRMGICDGGSLILHDANNTECAIDCRSDRFHHDLQGELVLISQWQWIKPSNPTLSSATSIEFLFQSVFRVDSDVPVLQQIMREDELAARDFRAKTPVTIEGHRGNESIHIAVQITSKSVLCGNRFFLGFTTATTADEDGIDTSRWSWRRMIGFQGDSLIPYYHDYCIGMFFLFVDLAVDPTNKQCVKFVEGRSRAHMITKDEYDAFLSPFDNPGIPSSPFTHAGVVTRVIDPLFGIYELDNQTMTCFFHCFNYNFMLPYRVGTHLRISTFHVVRLGASSALVPYWGIQTKNNDDQDHDHLIIVACLCSHIQTSAFPDVSLEQPSSTRPAFAAPSFPETHYLFRECCLTLSNFPCLLQKLELHGSLYRKLYQHIANEALNIAIVDTVRCLLGRRNIGDRKYDKFGNVTGDIFQHEQHCSVMGRDQPVISPALHRFPPLKTVIEELMASEDQLERLVSSYAMIPNTQELKSVDLAQYDFPCDEADMSTSVLGILEASDEDGRLYFVDDTYRIPIVIQSVDTLPPIGGLYLLKKFRLIQEDLSYTQITGEKSKLYSTYIICNARDMLRTANVSSRSQPSLVIPPVSARTVHHFTETKAKDEKVRICVLFIKTKQPVSLCLGDDNEFSLTAHANALCYGVSRGNGDGDISPPMEVTLVMRTGGLRYWPQLKVGHWYGLVGGTNVELFGPASNGSIPKAAIRICHTIDISRFIIPKTKLKQPLEPIFDLGSNTCLLRANELNSSDNIIRLEPVPNTTQNTAGFPVDMAPPVYQITDLLRPDQNSGPKMLVIQDRYFQDPVHVRGVVVSKMLCETQVPRGEVYEHSEELYRRFGVGTGQPGRTMMVRLRQTDGLDTFDVYMDMSSRPYPLGIIPGAEVTFYDLVRRKHAAGGVYGQAMTSTTVEVNRSSNPALDLREAFARDLIPRRMLAAVKGEMIQSMAHTVFRLDCTIQEITRLSLKWVCTSCGTVVKHNGCYNLCRQAPTVFVAETTIAVDDGTAKAQVYVESEAHIVRLLKLPPRAVTILKEAALEQGSLVYDCWITDDRPDQSVLPTKSTQDSKALEDLCREQINCPLTIYGRLIPRKKRTYNQDSVLGELKVLSKQVNNEVNDPFMTVTFPQLRIKVIDLEPLDPAYAAWSILNKFEIKGDQ